jgi:cardiolipin synthase A/B
MRSVFIAVTFIIGLACASGCHNGPTDRPYRIEHKYSVADPEFAHTMSSLLGPSLIGGNQTTTLVNGDQIFPAMLEAIAGAKKTINFETYIYWSGEIGTRFSDALAERAASGVQVHIIIDSVGSDRVSRRHLERLKDAGVKIVKYHPLRWYNLTTAQKLDNRTHRKLLVVDGVVGFTGGVGIADEWLGNAGSPEHWRDTHYRLRGPAVAQLQAAFADNWMESTGHVLHGDDYFPRLDPAGSELAQVFKSSPTNGSESMQLMYLLSLTAATKNIRLASSYFVPDQLTIDTLIAARRRGVQVQVIVPGKHIDVKVVRSASRARWGDLLKNGVEIFEYQPTMFHCKQLIIDDRWVSIGSANIDNRSFRNNDEANLNVLDEAFAAREVEIFENDLRSSKQITYDQWRRRPLPTKAWETFAGIFGFLM